VTSGRRRRSSSCCCWVRIGASSGSRSCTPLSKACWVGLAASRGLMVFCSHLLLYRALWKRLCAAGKLGTLSVLRGGRVGEVDGSEADPPGEHAVTATKMPSSTADAEPVSRSGRLGRRAGGSGWLARTRSWGDGVSGSCSWLQPLPLSRHRRVIFHTSIILLAVQPPCPSMRCIASFIDARLKRARSDGPCRFSFSRGRRRFTRGDSQRRSE
jgi:hypothetical protein